MNKLFQKVLKGRDTVAGSSEPAHKPPLSGRRVRIARPEDPEHHPHRHRNTDPPAATLPPAHKGKGRVASWRKAWEERLKK